MFERPIERSTLVQRVLRITMVLLVPLVSSYAYAFRRIDQAADRPASSAVAYAQVPFRGVNLAGAEFGVIDDRGTGNLPGQFGKDYVYPDPNYAQGYTSAGYYQSKGMTVFRLPFRWERLQRSFNGPFDAAELQRLHTTVAGLTRSGAYVVIDPHNYARYVNAVIGEDIPTSAFADFWSKLAAEFAAEDHVIFGLMNEPHHMRTTT